MSSAPKAAWIVLGQSSGEPRLRADVSTSELVKDLMTGKASWADFVKISEEPLIWLRICDIEEFRAYFPPLPSAEALSRLGRDSPTTIKVASRRGRAGIWYFQFQGSEFGPVSQSQLQKVLTQEKAGGALYIWRTGMKGWTAVSNIEEFLKLSQAETPAPGLPAEPSPRSLNEPLPAGQANHRAAPRIALVATISLILGPKHRSSVGICADISTTGFQLVMDGESEFTPGKIYPFEIFPVGTSGLSPIRINAKAMWLKNEERRAGFVFVDPSAEIQETLTAYVAAASRLPA